MTDFPEPSPYIPTDEELAAIPRISPRKAIVLAETGSAVLVDTRYRGSYEGGHIEGALSVSLEAIETGAPLPQLEAIPARQLLIFYCTCLDEYTSARAAVALIRRGCAPERLAVLEGGLHDWDRVGLPIVRVRHHH